MSGAIAAGIDLGGTKSEVQIFDADWTCIDRQRIETPRDYDALVQAVTGQVRWAMGQTDQPNLPIGIGAAGLIDRDGLALTANLVASGRPFPADINAAAGREVLFLNDCRALTLSEAVFGAGQGRDVVMSLILGTGVGGGLAMQGDVIQGPTHTGGEYGHAAAPARLIADHDLPIYDCGCGRRGCVETYIAGPGLARMASDALGRDVDTRELAALRGQDKRADQVWQIWCQMVAELILSLTYAVDPDCVVLAGGLSRIENVDRDVQAALAAVQIPRFSVPKVLIAQGGDASGARGAAFAAKRGKHHV